jgi:hypothetical protein
MRQVKYIWRANFYVSVENITSINWKGDEILDVREYNDQTEFNAFIVVLYKF